MVIAEARRRIAPAPGDDPKALFESSELEFELLQAVDPKQVRELACTAVKDGSTYLVCYGDDWTLHEVVNGVMNDGGPVNPELVIGVIPARHGSDFLRTFGLSSSPADAMVHLTGEPYFEVDVGRLTCSGKNGQSLSEYFINLAEVGLGADIVRRTGRMPSLIGRGAGLLAFWATMAAFRPSSGEVKMDRRTYQGPLTNVVVANGQFYRDGIRLAVKAHPADGKFDVLVQKGTKRDYVETMTKSFKGEHLPSKVIKEYMAGRVEVSSADPLPMEADGRFVGRTPATFELVHHAYRLKI